MVKEVSTQYLQPRQRTFGPDINIPGIDPRLLEQAAQREPGLLDYLAQGLGGGLGQGLAEGIPNAIRQEKEQTNLRNILNQLENAQSPLEKYKVLAQNPELLKSYQPYLKAEQEEKSRQAEQERRRKYAELLSHSSGNISKNQEQIGQPQEAGAPNKPFNIENYVDPKNPNKIDFAKIPLQDKLIEPPTLEDMEGLTTKEQADLIKQNAKQNTEITKRHDKLERDRREEGIRANEKYIASVRSGFQTAKKKLTTLEQMRELNSKEGTNELSGPLRAIISDKLHIPIQLIGGKYTDEQYQKLALDLTSGITGEYGSRILETEFNTFLRRIPTLINSKKGREEIIENLNRIYNIPIKEYETFREVSKQDPYAIDLQDKIYDVLYPKRLNINGQVYDIPLSDLENVLKAHPELRSQLGGK